MYVIDGDGRLLLTTSDQRLLATNMREHLTLDIYNKGLEIIDLVLEWGLPMRYRYTIGKNNYIGIFTKNTDDTVTLHEAKNISEVEENEAIKRLLIYSGHLHYRYFDREVG